MMQWSGVTEQELALTSIDTEMNQWMEEDELIALVDEIPAGRLGKAEEVADLAYHLGSFPCQWRSRQ